MAGGALRVVDKGVNDWMKHRSTIYKSEACGKTEVTKSFLIKNDNMS